MTSANIAEVFPEMGQRVAALERALEDESEPFPNNLVVKHNVTLLPSAAVLDPPLLLVVIVMFWCYGCSSL